MSDFRNAPIRIFKSLLSGPGLFSFALCAAIIIVTVIYGSDDASGDINKFEAGMVADRDIVAGFTVSFPDEEATLIRLEFAEKQVPAVFRFSVEAGEQILDSWNDFCDLADSDAFRVYGAEALDTLLKRGIFAVHHEEVERFDPAMAELLVFSESGLQAGFISYNDILTAADVRKTLGEIIKNMEAPDVFKASAVDLVNPFVRENVFFSPEESQRRIDKIREQTAPVIYTIEKGKKIIRKGFVITEDDMRELRALYSSYHEKDPRKVIGSFFLVLLFYILFIMLRGRIFLKRALNSSERYLVSALIGFYIIGSVLLKNLSPGFEGFPVALAVPTALFIMIFAVFWGTRLALIMALILPLCSYLTGAFDYSSYIIALVPGAVASAVLHNAQNRMSLIKAGLVIAAANCFAVIVALLLGNTGFHNYPALLFWAVMNGIVSGMFILGFLPPLERALSAVTPFSLIELSDLNAPVLRRLFTTAPGTYSHSIMVATLAEQACQDIGANALLARVGAYYHDIGKMDNPGYFVENQTDHNMHDDISPRLSATIIRSHVKLGVEKARNMKLPRDVIAIISEHHGNSVISWFYNKAAEQEETVSSDDFTYPGTPPHSRESAVVMLADITEAAVRTLIKPTPGKIEKFIQQLFEDKVDHGQLAESDLTFRDLEIIKGAFVKVLAGYYHARIEYPKRKEGETE
ncbi:MAG: HDIG domain-containing protein [Treponema sp.]|jgi:putative nucleotidyltransferase with HDIG domain|nr:HDIG domain-containing protein [Treponema sp.]